MDDIDKLIENTIGKCGSHLISYDDLRAVAGRARCELARKLLAEAKGPMTARSIEMQRSEPGGSAYAILVTLIIGRLREIAGGEEWPSATGTDGGER